MAPNAKSKGKGIPCSTPPGGKKTAKVVKGDDRVNASNAASETSCPQKNNSPEEGWGVAGHNGRIAKPQLIHVRHEYFALTDLLESSEVELKAVSL